ncbi:hypothetical protein K1719_037284 [Acacia pycnantha]|nr:hypothetical protein K1719_037284 [Acacia pycnantha]
MAQNGSSSSAQILMAIMVVGLFCFTKIVGQDPNIAPTPPLEAGDGFALPVSGMALCSSLLISIVAFMLQ